MQTSGAGFRRQDKTLTADMPAREIYRFARRFALLHLLFFSCYSLLYAADLTSVVSGLQQRYASVQTIAGDFQQTYRAPGISQVESGSFKLKRPGLMRWEYRIPEEKLFIADGRESFLYVPGDRQVTIQPFSAADLHNTPLELLLGSADINRSYSASWEEELKPKVEGTYLVRLTPRAPMAGYSFIVVELDQRTYDLRRIVIRETIGNTSEFLLTNVITNIKAGDKEFRFKPPKGVEKIRMKGEE